jgi:sugar lactone lactonase YvrE
MRRNIFIAIGLALIVLILVFLIKDFFLKEKGSSENPHEYNLEKIRKGDSLTVAFKEIKRFTPALEEIYGLTVDPSDRIFVCGKGGVEIYDNSGKRESQFTVDGTARCIAVDANGKIYLGMEDHVEIFTPDYKKHAIWKPESSESVLTSIAVAQNNVFVADAGEKIVYRYDLKGNLLNKIGAKDPQNNIPGFFIPSGYFDLAFDPSGRLWIVDPGHHTLNQFSVEGELLSSWGESSMSVEGFCGCCNPSHIAFLPDGSFLTSEKSIERIKIYDTAGVYQNLVATPESFEEGTRGLDLAIDSQERILVLDPVKKQVRFFVKKI